MVLIIVFAFHMRRVTIFKCAHRGCLTSRRLLVLGGYRRASGGQAQGQDGLVVGAASWQRGQAWGAV